MKAIGYTVNQLKIQFCYRLLLTLVFGTVMEAILAVSLANELLTILFQKLGIEKIRLIWNLLFIMSVWDFMCLFSAPASVE